MTPPQYQRAMQLVEVLMDCEPDELQARIREECAGDDLLRREVEKLLAQDKPESRFLEESPLNVLSSTPADDEQGDLIGKCVGPYRITEEIGRGGMGAVYKGVRDDEHYQTEVAIKLIKRGMDTDYILRKFRNERQIQANLNHPNIVRLLDGGTTPDGLPYFVMEHIEGQPLDEYCNEQRLSIAERLNLFQAVCSAVQYAHQHLVIHRDLKPSNILVTSNRTPKLLDFGIAKILLSDSADQITPATATVFRVMTPEYASPEQVRGQQITTASDVYSLGVLLYELLTGQRPYRFKSRRADEIAHVICYQEPLKPSTAISRDAETAAGDKATPPTTKPARASEVRDDAPAKLRRHLRGDLDNIVLMAMRKDPERRYASVEQFSADIQRHLDGLPVRARKDTLSYRSAKYIKRNRVGLAATSLIALTLIGGIIATAWQARAAHVERARAERRFDDVRRLANSFLFELNDQIEQGPTKARELLVERALEYLDSLAHDAGSDLSLQRELAAAYQKVGDVQSQLHHANIGDSQGALKSYQKSLSLREAIVAADPESSVANLDLAVGYNRIGDILTKTGDTGAALVSYRKALNLFERLRNSNQKDPTVLREMTANYLSLGRALLKTGSSSDALVNFRQAQVIRETLAAENPEDAKLQQELMAAYETTAFVLMESRDTAEALALYRKSLEIGEALLAANPTSAAFRRSVHSSHWGLGVTLRSAGDTGGALSHHQKALDLAQQLLGADPTNIQARNDLADTYMEYANTLRDARQGRAALANYREAIRSYEIVWDADRNNIHARRQIYYTYQHLGEAQAQAGDTADALETFRLTLAAFQELSARDPANTEFQHDLAISYRKFGEMLLNTADTARALENFRQALPLIESLSAQSPMNALKRRDLALTYLGLGAAQTKLASKKMISTDQQKEHWNEARAWYQKSSGIWQEMRSKGTLRGADSGKPDEVAREIIRCDAALDRSG
jgi:serine/threonine protein kinase